MNVCSVSDERKRIQHFDKQFKENSKKRFKLPARKYHEGTTLRVDQQVTADPHITLATWEKHFTAIYQFQR